VTKLARKSDHQENSARSVRPARTEGAGRLVVVLGPTASGKSELAIRLAQRFGGEVVACDSTQVYRRFDIGTGKVPVEERRGIAHWMLDLIEPDEVFTAGDYRRRAEAVLADIRERGKVAVVTAGTGLYLRALLEGLSEAPVRCEALRERLRNAARAHEAGYLHRLLTKMDREAASRIAGADEQKIIRAIEIRLLAKQPVKTIQDRERPALEGFDVVKVGLRPARTKLYEAINRRVEEMFRAGWVAEVEGLLREGISVKAKPFTFIGYRQIAEYLGGVDAGATSSATDEAKLKEMIAAIQQATRNFAKRQMTWFGRERDVNWVEAFGHKDKAFELVACLLD
jgi:tRNA dimethylallyltransferase